jgi:hypothetical protein
MGEAAVYFCRAAVPRPGADQFLCLSLVFLLAGRFWRRRFFTPGIFPFLASRSNCFRAYLSSPAAILASVDCGL